MFSVSLIVACALPSPAPGGSLLGGACRGDLGGVSSGSLGGGQGGSLGTTHTRPGAPCPLPLILHLSKKLGGLPLILRFQKNLVATLAHAHIAPTLKTLSDFSRSHADIAPP
jgi:hypothetical protein